MSQVTITRSLDTSLGTRMYRVTEFSNSMHLVEVYVAESYHPALFSGGTTRRRHLRVITTGKKRDAAIAAFFEQHGNRR